MHFFQLDRRVDVSGISGTGVVATGCEFEDGLVLLRWPATDHNPCHSLAIYRDMQMMRDVCCHDQSTVVNWLLQYGQPQTGPVDIPRDHILMIAVHAALTAQGLIEEKLSWI